MSQTSSNGEIRLPAIGAKRLPRPYPTRVLLSGIPDGHHVWLAVERDGQFWPKEPSAPPRAREWETVVHEGGPANKEFALSLWLVTPEVDEAIRVWFGSAGAHGWPPITPPLTDIPGAVRLHTVAGLTVC